MKHTLNYERERAEFFAYHCPASFDADLSALDREYDGVPWDVEDVITDAYDEYKQSREDM